MIKARVTFREVREGFCNVYSVHYCGIQDIEQYLPCYFYSCGIYGWNCDYYVVSGNTIISTGYRPIGKHLDYKVVEKYNNEFYKLPYEKKNTETATEYLKKIIAESEERIVD